MGPDAIGVAIARTSGTWGLLSTAGGRQRQGVWERSHHILDSHRGDRDMSIYRSARMDGLSIAQARAYNRTETSGHGEVPL
jgi:hypothetical protein